MVRTWRDRKQIRRPRGSADHPIRGHECQFASRVAMSQLKEPRVMQIGMSDPGMDGPTTLRVGVLVIH